MRLNTIYPADGSKRVSKRAGCGRGSGLGKTGGRGQKGQKSRSGGRIRRGFEGGQMPIYRRIPKFGFISRKSKVIEEISLEEIKSIKGNIVELNTLKVANIVARRIKLAKIILSGEIKRSVTVRGLRVSKGARAAIEAVGGKVE